MCIAMGVLSVLAVIAGITLWLTPNCLHDWEYLERQSDSKIHYDVECERSGKRLPRVTWAGESRDYHRRVCLKCRKVEDTIYAERVMYLLELERAERRQKRAEEILGDDLPRYDLGEEEPV